MMRLKAYGAMTDQGPVRPVNEDRYGIDPKHGLFGVFDGLGGGGIGDIAAEFVSSRVADFFFQSTKDQDATMPFIHRPQYLLETNNILNALSFAHRKLADENKKRKLENRAAVSVSVAAFQNGLVSLVGVGNCRAFLLRRGKLESLLPVDTIRYFCTEPDRSHLRDLPLWGVGYEQEPNPHVFEFRVRQEDSLWLVTSGVAPFLEAEDYSESLRVGGDNPQAAVKHASKLATMRGSTGNQTIVVLQF